MRNKIKMPLNPCWLLTIAAAITTPAHAKLVEYSFSIDTIDKNITGEHVTALAIGGQIPAPLIEAQVGDTLRVTFVNKMSVESSVHWHGVLLPNDQDGVPYLTTQPIKAHSTFTYEFPITHSGTYWYHSHTGLQEQRGIYGPIVFHPKSADKPKVNSDEVIVFSDWTNESPRQVMQHLKQDGDYYALKKDSVQSWGGAMQYGWPAIKNRLHSAWTRMGPMDLSDVGYDAFLANGNRHHQIKAKAGDKIRLRLINAAASSYFYVEYAGGPMTVVAADGIDIQPVKVQRLRMAMAETYDVIVDVPAAKAYELRNTSEDGTGYASTYIGSGEKIVAPDIARPNLYLADHSMQHMSHGKMTMHHAHHMDPAVKPRDDETKPQDDEAKPQDDETKPQDDEAKPQDDEAKPRKDRTVSILNNYQPLKAKTKTTLPANHALRTINLNLTGNMERYVWSFNNKTLSEADRILIHKGENVRFVLQNMTMMHHPVHLHGHFFRVLNGQGEYSPLKHTVNVPAMGKVIIEFEANEEKDWFFHCHNLYHMFAGMARVVTYPESSTVSQSNLQKLWHDQQWYHAADLGFYTNMSSSSLRFSNSRNAIELAYDYDYNKAYDAELIYERNLSRFLDLYLGAEFEREDSDKNPEHSAIVGMHYVLPMLIESDIRLNSDGETELGLSSELQLTSRTKFIWGWDTTGDYQLRLDYEFTKKFILSSHYDADEYFGLGLRFRF